MSNKIFRTNSNKAESNTSGLLKESCFQKNTWPMILFSLPVIYLGIIIAVFIHEVMGHGLTAFFLGGDLNRFYIQADGMGWADIAIQALSSPRKVLILFSGAFYTMMFAVLFFALNLVFRKKFIARITFLYLAFTCFMDGLPYFFWDAIYLGGIGDFSIIWALWPKQLLRILLIVLGGGLMIVGIVIFNTLLYKTSYEGLGEGRPLKLKEKISLSLIIFGFQFIGWFSFDWDQLIPGVGFLPGILSIIITVLTLIVLIFFHKIEGPSESQAIALHWKGPLAIAWILCLGVVFSIVQWFQNGCKFF